MRSEAIRQTFFDHHPIKVEIIFLAHLSQGADDGLGRRLTAHRFHAQHGQIIDIEEMLQGVHLRKIR